MTQSWAQINIPTYHNDNGRTGANSNETSLTPANVNMSSFGLAFTSAIPDGNKVYAQPLYVANVNIAGQGTHNVVIVATMGDMVYAFDADGLSNSPLWTADLSNSANGGAPIPCNDVTGSDAAGCYLGPVIGILSTPVIDTGSGTLYAVAQTEENSAIVERLHALDIGSGGEKFGGPVVIQGSVPGTGAGSDGQNIAFNPKIQNQRSALLLANGRVYIAWGSYGDAAAPYHGWVMAYDATTLAQVAIWNNTPNGSAGGIWTPGDLMADASGNIFVTSGNGDSTAQSGGTEYSNSVVKLDSSLNVLDFFMPPNVSDLNTNDLDLNGGGFVDTGAGLLIGGGKDGTIYVIDGNHLGGWDPNGGNVVQSFPNALGGSGCQSDGCLFALPAISNGIVSFIGPNDVLKVLSFSNNALSGPTSQGTTVFSIRGAPPSISSNSGNNAVLWAVDVGDANGNRLILHAYDATNAARELWNSDQSGGADALGNGALFIPPTVANGRVYVAATGQLVAYALKNGSGGGTGGGGGGGSCAAPSSPGVNICSPVNGSTVTSPFTISAAGTDSSQTQGMDVWLDGQKLSWFGGTNTVNIQQSPSAGSHQLDIYAVGSNNELQHSTSIFTVGSSSGGSTGGTGGGSCSQPSSPGVNICSPTKGSSVSSPVTISAAGRNAGSTDGMDVWIDGAKLGFFQGTTVSTQATLAAGSHQLDIYAVGSDGSLQQSTVIFTVTSSSGGGTSGSSACSPPTGPGVVICSPPNGSTQSSSFHILAYGMNSGSTSGMDVWLDGNKVGWFGGTTTVDTSASAASGSHQLDIYAVGTDGSLEKATSIFTTP